MGWNINVLATNDKKWNQQTLHGYMDSAVINTLCKNSIIYIIN